MIFKQYLSHLLLLCRLRSTEGGKKKQPHIFSLKDQNYTKKEEKQKTPSSDLSV